MTLFVNLAHFPQEEDARTVQVKGSQVPIRTMMVEDTTGKAKVTLWRECCDTEVRTGDFVTITDVIINVYKQETSFSTTQRTQIEE